MSDEDADSTAEPEAVVPEDSPFEIQPLDAESKNLDVETEVRSGD